MKGFGVFSKGNVGWMEKPDPICGSDDAIVKPLAIVPCTSDVHSAYEMEGDYLKNRILGHESVGQVIEAGANVHDFKVGDRVVIPCVTPTWKHPDIEDGLHQHAGGPHFGFNFSAYEDGCFADIIKVRSADMNLALLPDSIKPETAVMITDMMTTGFHGAELAQVKYGDTIVVFGIGPVGLMAVGGAALMGAGKLIAIGTRPDCVKIAREYGATQILSYKDGDLYAQIMDATGGKGADATIVAGGNLETFYTAVATCKPGGIVSNLNVFTEIESFDIPYSACIGFLAHKTIKGGLCPGGRKRMERLLAVVEAGRIDPGKLITHRFDKFEDIEIAFKLMVNKPRDLIKPVVNLE